MTDKIEPVLSDAKLRELFIAYTHNSFEITGSDILRVGRSIEAATIAKLRASVAGAEPVAWMQEDGSLHTTRESAYFKGGNVVPLCPCAAPAPADDVTSLLGVIADIRVAAGDPKGKLMLDELVARVAALAAQAPAQGAWLPIESAPIGENVLVSNANLDVGEAYCDPFNGWIWANRHPTDAQDVQVRNPLYWMQLPDAAPVTQDASR